VRPWRERTRAAAERYLLAQSECRPRALAEIDAPADVGGGAGDPLLTATIDASGAEQECEDAREAWTALSAHSAAQRTAELELERWSAEPQADAFAEARSLESEARESLRERNSASESERAESLVELLAERGIRRLQRVEDDATERRRQRTNPAEERVDRIAAFSENSITYARDSALLQSDSWERFELYRLLGYQMASTNLAALHPDAADAEVRGLHQDETREVVRGLAVIRGNVVRLYRGDDASDRARPGAMPKLTSTQGAPGHARRRGRTASSARTCS